MFEFVKVIIRNIVSFFTSDDTGVTATEALQLAEDRPFWRTIATAGGFG